MDPRHAAILQEPRLSGKPAYNNHDLPPTAAPAYVDQTLTTGNQRYNASSLTSDASDATSTQPTIAPKQDPPRFLRSKYRSRFKNENMMRERYPMNELLRKAEGLAEGEEPAPLLSHEQRAKMSWNIAGATYELDAPAGMQDWLVSGSRAWEREGIDEQAKTRGGKDKHSSAWMLRNRQARTRGRDGSVVSHESPMSKAASSIPHNNQTDLSDKPKSTATMKDSMPANMPRSQSSDLLVGIKASLASVNHQNEKFRRAARPEASQGSTAQDMRQVQQDKETRKVIPCPLRTALGCTGMDGNMSSLLRKLSNSTHGIFYCNRCKSLLSRFNRFGNAGLFTRLRKMYRDRWKAHLMSCRDDHCVMPACAPHADGEVRHKRNENCETNREDEDEADVKYLFSKLGVPELGIEIGRKADHKCKRRSTARKILRVAEDATQPITKLESELRDRNQELEMLEQLDHEHCRKVHELRPSNKELDYAIENVFSTILSGLAKTQNLPNVLAQYRIYFSRTRRVQCNDQLEFGEVVPFCRYLLTESVEGEQVNASLNAYLLMEIAKSPSARASSMDVDGLSSIWDIYKIPRFDLSSITCRTLPTSNLHELSALEIMRMSLRTIALNVRQVHIVPKIMGIDEDNMSSNDSIKRTGALAAKVAEEPQDCVCNPSPESTVKRSRTGSHDAAAVEDEPEVVMTQALQYSKGDADMDTALPTIESYGRRYPNEDEAVLMELRRSNSESLSDTPDSAGQMHAHGNSRARGKKHSYTKRRRPQSSRALASDGDSTDDSDIIMAYDRASSEDSDFTGCSNANRDSGIFWYHSPSSGASGSSTTQHSTGTSHRSSVGFGRDGVLGSNKSLEIGKESGLHGLGSSEEGVQIIDCPRQKRTSRIKVIPCPITGCPGKECDISRLIRKLRNAEHKIFICQNCWREFDSVKKVDKHPDCEKHCVGTKCKPESNATTRHKHDSPCKEKYDDGNLLEVRKQEEYDYICQLMGVPSRALEDGCETKHRNQRESSSRRKGHRNTREPADRKGCLEAVILNQQERIRELEVAAQEQEGLINELVLDLQQALEEMSTRHSPSGSLRGRICRHAPGIFTAFEKPPPSSNLHGRGGFCAQEPPATQSIHAQEVSTTANEASVPAGSCDISDPQGFADRNILSQPPTKRARLRGAGEDLVPDHDLTSEAWSLDPHRVGMIDMGQRRTHIAEDHCIAQSTPDRQVLDAQMLHAPPSHQISQSSAEMTTNYNPLEYALDNAKIHQLPNGNLDFTDQYYSHEPQPLSAMVNPYQAAGGITDSLYGNPGFDGGSFDFSLHQQVYGA